MGICSSCFKGTSTDIPQPDMVTRRRQLVEAAEKRQKESESRGIKDIDKVKRQQQRAEEYERKQLEASKYGSGEPVLKWTQG